MSIRIDIQADDEEADRLNQILADMVRRETDAAGPPPTGSPSGPGAARNNLDLLGSGRRRWASGRPWTRAPRR